jgi:hypothetical protein
MVDYLKHAIEAWGPRAKIAYGRWAPSSATTQTITAGQTQGVASITRNSIGNYTINLQEACKELVAVVGVVENDTTVRHVARVESFDAAAGTVTVSHKVTTFAAEAGAVVVNASRMTDVATTETVYAVSPVAGTLSRVQTVVVGGGATNGAAVVTPSINGVAVTNGAVTIASGAVVGEVDSAVPTAANTVAIGDTISAASDGGGSTTTAVEVQYTIQSTAGTPAGSDTVDQLVFFVVMRMTD